MKRLEWARRLQAIAQAGLTYAKDPYDLERYKELRSIAVDMLAADAGLDREQLRIAFASGEGYPTPKVDVRAVVFREGKILLTKERADGGFTLPGGWADVGSSPGEMAARETLEETGYVVRPVKLLAVLDKAKHGHPPQPSYIYKLFILCELTGGSPAASIETAESGFFSRDAIPPLSLDRVTQAQIARMFAHADDPSLPADFD
jgi:ADP-ribose pyrophosphatase YjhB (NUDIX family)